ncbi:MAG: 3'(2'),5'-bisphosphate nucleotidase CysQ [Pararhizobium sp.]
MPGADISPEEAAADLALIRDAAIDAGDMALGYFRQNPDVWYKNHDRSPVSAADLAIDAMLHERLGRTRPDYGWLSEEREDTPERLSCDRLFVVDPIDGTRSFISGKELWCISVAVVSGGRSVAGVLVAPATGEVFAAHAGGAARKNGSVITVRPAPQTGEKLVVAAPTRLTSRLPAPLAQMIASVGHIPSLAYRIAMVADGRLDATLVREDANDWDIAAAHIILECAGGGLVKATGEAVTYNRAQTRHGILIAGSGAVLPRLAAASGELAGH